MESDRVLSHIASQLQGNEHLLVAYSGGLDSTVLLHGLVTLRQTVMPDLRIRAIHIRHGLSRNENIWSEHCQSCCQWWRVPFISQPIHLQPQGKGIEAAAREARYQMLREQLQPDEIVMTAQHLDDQCETLLLALKRGSGPAGLSSMLERIPFAEGILARPLLALSRQQLWHYAQQQQLTWVEDESNQDDIYDRNFLRLEIIPLLQRRWPSFSKAVARSAALCGEQEQLLDELLAEKLSDLCGQDGSLSIEGLQRCSQAKRNALLRRWIAMIGATMPSREKLSHLWQQVVLSQPDAEPCLRLGEWQIRRFRQRLYLLPPLANLAERIVPWNGLSVLQLPDQLGYLQQGRGTIIVRPPKAEEVVTIRFSVSGRIRLSGRQHSRTVKKIWQELNVAPWLRHRIPLLFYNEQLIAALGYLVTAEGEPGEGAVWQIEWVKDTCRSL